jgi:hypothetical protein
MSGDQAGAASALKTQLGGMDIGAMNAFQKQALTQATGMDISALMGLQQGKDGGLSGELKAEQNKGKAFADGALNQDIANAGAKMKLEQEQRAKMLAFEQRQRLIMLTLEQAQRLEGIALEQKYRALTAGKNYEDTKNIMAAEMLKDAGSGFINNQMAGTAGALDSNKLIGAAKGDFQNAINGVDLNISQLINSGAIKGSDARLANYLTQKFDILENAGKEGFNATQIAEKLSDAMTKSFGSEVGAYNEAAAKKKKEQEGAIVAFEKITAASAQYQDHIKRLGAGGSNFKAQEVDKATAAAKKQYPELFAQFEKSVGGTLSASNATQGTQFINGLKNTLPKPLDAKGTAVATAVGNKSVVNAANIQVGKQGEVIEQQKTMLTESAYQIALQQEMVALTGLSTQILDQILQKTNDEDYVIKLGGFTLTQSLRDQARRNYFVNRLQ